MTLFWQRPFARFSLPCSINYERWPRLLALRTALRLFMKRVDYGKMAKDSFFYFPEHIPRIYIQLFHLIDRINFIDHRFVVHQVFDFSTLPRTSSAWWRSCWRCWFRKICKLKVFLFYIYRCSTNDKVKSEINFSERWNWFSSQWIFLIDQRVVSLLVAHQLRGSISGTSIESIN